MRNYTLYILVLLLFSVGCKNQKNNEARVLIDSNILESCNANLKNAMVIDHITPPVASRRMMYANVAAYEALVPFYTGYISYFNQVKGLPQIILPDTQKKYCLDLIALAAFTKTSWKLVFQEDSVINFRTRLLEKYQKILPKETYHNSIQYGDTVASQIIKWAKKDGYDSTRTAEQYLPLKGNAYWQPTPPDYQEAIEPHWKSIRTAVIPTSDYIKIDPPEPYSENKNSRFYQITKQVYDQVKNQDSATKNIGFYWDDNPNITQHYGHATINVLKVSPGGHWLALFGYMAKQKKLSLMPMAEGYSRLSLVIYDAFIGCWDEKYRSHYLRPVSSIKKMIDSTWLPPIQTPPFPEYPSGHSVVSTAAGITLTHLFGAVSFTDSTEVPYGFAPRKFKDFMEAANEACISRLYGGIHFIDAIEKGKNMGQGIADYHIKHLQTRRKNKKEMDSI